MNQHQCLIEDVKMDLVEPSEFRAAMRNLTCGVVIIATGSGPDRRGMTATSVCSLSDSPPSVLVSILKTSETHDVLLRNGTFSVNLTALSHRDLADRFSGRTGIRGSARFERGDWGSGPTGAPVLMDSPASFDCEVERTFDGGTHTIVVGFVRDIGAGAAEPMLAYLRGTYGAISAPAD